MEAHSISVNAWLETGAQPMLDKQIKPTNRMDFTLLEKKKSKTNAIYTK